MRPTVSQYARALEELAVETEPKVLVSNIRLWLKRRGEEKKFPLIVRAFEKRLQIKEKKVVVTAVTAHELTEGSRSVILKKAQALFPDQTVEVESRVDKAIIGGVKLSTDEQLYDGTVKTRLLMLKNSLLKG